MTAPVNLIVDFLFVEVLSAPTIDSLKKESKSSSSPSSIQRVFRQASKIIRKASVASTNTLNKLGNLKSNSNSNSKSNSNSNSKSNSNSDNWTELISTTRVIPPRTREAHNEAVECANDVISNAKSRLEDRSRMTKSRHETFLKSHTNHKSNQHRRRTDIPTRTSGIRSSSFLLTRLSSILRLPSLSVGENNTNTDTNHNNNNHNNNTNTNININGRKVNMSLMEKSVDGVFEQLSYDINQQRRLLKRSQQEVFDNLWG